MSNQIRENKFYGSNIFMIIEPKRRHGRVTVKYQPLIFIELTVAGETKNHGLK